MKRIVYPKALKKGDYIAVTAPSSGVEERLHHLLNRAKENLENLGFNIIEGNTIWTNDKCVSAPKEIRARELQDFLLDDRIKAVIPPWGGEFLMELLPMLDWERLRNQSPKWILGYSDISTFTFAYTLLTGFATAHGTNYIDLSADPVDPTTARWVDILSNEEGSTIKQHSSTLYRSSWDVPLPDTPTNWGILNEQDNGIRLSGRLIGGCLDTLSILLGTSYAPVERFSNEYCQDTGLIWYLESCEMSSADIYRHLWQLKECGWFNNTNGFIFGRAAGYSPVKNFELVDALQHVFGSMNIPVIYKADIGHLPPQITFVNGAYAEISCYAGKGEVNITFS